MTSKEDWKKLTEILQDTKFEEILPKLKDGTIKARGNFETDQMYQDKEDGLVECDEDENFPRNIQEITANCWETYRYNHSNNTLGKITSTKHGTVGWYNYSDIEINMQKQSATSIEAYDEEKISVRESQIHREIGETLIALQKKTPNKKISATRVWNYLKLDSNPNTCIKKFSSNNGSEFIEWVSPYGTPQYLQRSTFNNIVSEYKTGKKSIDI